MSRHWTFTDEPLPQKEQEATIEYYSTEQALGSELSKQEHIEGRITLGKWYMWRLATDSAVQSNGGIDKSPDTTHTDEVNLNQIDRRDSTRSFYLLRLPFTLHPPYGNQHYDEVRLNVQLEDDETARPYELFPHDITMEEDVKQVFTLSPSLKFKELEGSIGSAELSIEYTNLRPVISAYGVGESDFYWIYDDPQGNGVPSGTKYSLVVMDVPVGTTTVSGRLSWGIVLKKRVLGKFRSKKTAAEEYPFTWRLDESDVLPGPWLAA